MGDRAPTTGDAAAAPPQHGVMVDLKRHTARLHRGLERRLDLMSPALDLARYRAVLRGFARVFGALDDELSRVLPRGYGYERRLPLLAADLATLGGPTPPPGAPVGVATAAQGIGALYVVEGARLGGRHVAARLRRTLGAVPTSFFTGEGDADTAWAGYRRLASDELADAGARGAAVDAARAVFARLHQEVPA